MHMSQKALAEATARVTVYFLIKVLQSLSAHSQAHTPHLDSWQ